MMTTYQDIEQAFAGTGIRVRGGFTTNADEDPASSTIVLLGNAGPDMWAHFSAARPDDANPLDAWTMTIVRPLAETLGATPIFPNDKPYRPFQRWAMRAEPVQPSPIGILIHPTYGLWHAYRAALLFTGLLDGVPQRTDAPNPCDSCADQPCLKTCPVDAFSAEGYDVPRCVAFLRTETSQPCHDGGCQARFACPVAQDQQYTQAQRAFHGAAFFRSRR